MNILRGGRNYLVRSHFLSNVSRDPSLPKGRQTDDISEKEVKEILGDLPIERSQLIEALHLIQDEFNCLSQKHLKALSELFKISQAEVFEVASFYHHFDFLLSFLLFSFSANNCLAPDSILLPCELNIFGIFMFGINFPRPLKKSLPLEIILSFLC